MSNAFQLGVIKGLMDVSDNSGHVAICLPAHNENPSLRVLILEIIREIESLSWEKVTLIVFDDGSLEPVAPLVDSLEMPGVEVLVLRSLVSRGKSEALGQAFSLALDEGATSIVMMDADGQDDPGYLGPLVAEVNAGASVVNGRRTNRAHSQFKRLSSKIFNATVRAITGIRIWDINSGYKGFSRQGAEAIRPYLYGELHRVIMVVATWLGLPVGEVAVVNRPRIAGRTKYGVSRGWRGVFDLMTVQFLRKYNSKPGHLFSGVGFFLGVLGLGGGALGVIASAGMDDTGLAAVSVSVGFVVSALGLMLVGMGFVAELVVFAAKSPTTSFVSLSRKS